MGSYKTVNKDSSCETFFVTKAERDRGGGKGLDREVRIWYNNGAVGKTASQKASGRRGRKN